MSRLINWMLHPFSRDVSVAAGSGCGIEGTRMGIPKLGYHPDGHIEGDPVPISPLDRRAFLVVSATSMMAAALPALPMCSSLSDLLNNAFTLEERALTDLWMLIGYSAGTGTLVTTNGLEHALDLHRQASDAFQEVVRRDPENPLGLEMLGPIQKRAQELDDLVRTLHGTALVEPSVLDPRHIARRLMLVA
jgi:hypothetical protein